MKKDKEEALLKKREEAERKVQILQVDTMSLLRMRMVLVVKMVIGVIVILMVVVLGKARRNRPNSRVHLPSY